MATVLTEPQNVTQPKIRQTKILIDNKWVDSVSGKTFETVNPATGEVIAKVAEADAADVDLAVKAARKAFNSKHAWRRMAAADATNVMSVQNARPARISVRDVDVGSPSTWIAIAGST